MSSKATVQSSFIPRLLSERLAAGGFAGPEATVARGAVLLTDIAGFTSMVDRSMVSRADLEELNQSFNSYFTRLVELVYAHGGDVMSVAGDAIFCYWPGTDVADVPAAILRAARAGLEIQSTLGLKPGGADHGFAMRIGI